MCVRLSESKSFFPSLENFAVPVTPTDGYSIGGSIDSVLRSYSGSRDPVLKNSGWAGKGNYILLASCIVCLRIMQIRHYLVCISNTHGWRLEGLVDLKKSDFRQTKIEVSGFVFELKNNYPHIVKDICVNQLINLIFFLSRRSFYMLNPWIDLISNTSKRFGIRLSF